MDGATKNQEEILSDRIAAIRKKNALLEKRHKEVENDRLTAENDGMTIESNQNRYVILSPSLKNRNNTNSRRWQKNVELQGRPPRSNRIRGTRAHTICGNCEFHNEALQNQGRQSHQSISNEAASCHFDHRTESQIDLHTLCAQLNGTKLTPNLCGPIRPLSNEENSVREPARRRSTVRFKAEIDRCENGVARRGHPKLIAQELADLCLKSFNMACSSNSPAESTFVREQTACLPPSFSSADGHQPSRNALLPTPTISSLSTVPLGSAYVSATRPVHSDASSRFRQSHGATQPWPRGYVICAGAHPELGSSVHFPHSRRGSRGRGFYRGVKHQQGRWQTNPHPVSFRQPDTNNIPMPSCSLPVTKHDSDSGASSSDSRLVDEYIDDTLLDDLDQYILKIDMDNGFVVYDALVPDPILQRPLRPWFEDGLSPDTSDLDRSTGGRAAILVDNSMPNLSEPFQTATDNGVLSAGDDNSNSTTTLKAPLPDLQQSSTAIAEEQTSSTQASLLSSALRDPAPYLTLVWGCTDT